MKRKARLTVTVDSELVQAGNRAVKSGRAESLSSWVNDALAVREASERRLRAMAAAVGAGLPVQYPRISGQYSDYTETQLRAFRAGERMNDANGMMRAIAGKLSYSDTNAVSDYIAGLH